MIGLNQILTAAILGLCGWIWYQSDTISDIRAENQVQAQTIKAQQEVNNVLNVALQQERAAVIEQQQENAKIEDEANAKAETIRTIIKTQPCARTRLPEPIEWMRK
nr:MAG TPA: Protein of unknown function (DUF2570) [Caudoviricetes sp.]